MADNGHHSHPTTSAHRTSKKLVRWHIQPRLHHLATLQDR